MVVFKFGRWISPKDASGAGEDHFGRDDDASHRFDASHHFLCCLVIGQQLCEVYMGCAVCPMARKKRRSSSKRSLIDRKELAGVRVPRRPFKLPPLSPPPPPSIPLRKGIVDVHTHEGKSNE